MFLEPMKVLHCRNRDFRLFCPWPWPWPDDLHIRTWAVSPRDVRQWTSYVNAFASYRQTDRQTDRYDQNYIPRRL